MRQAHLKVIEARKALRIAAMEAADVAIEEMNRKGKRSFLECDLPYLPSDTRLEIFKYLEKRGFHIYRIKDYRFYYEFFLDPQKTSLFLKREVDLRKGLK